MKIRITIRQMQKLEIQYEYLNIVMSSKIHKAVIYACAPENTAFHMTNLQERYPHLMYKPIECGISITNSECEK